jgi:NAD(P)-dependent dehydrogenase (short-subunit alcohol dehydrogenase family)
MKGISELHIVVVGASGSIGRAFAQAARAEGAVVTVAGRSDPGLDLPYLALDVTSGRDCDVFVDHLAGLDSAVDVLVNCTGVHHASFELGTAGAAEFEAEFARVCATNLQGAFNLTAAIAQLFVRQGQGHLIHLCSDASRLALYGSHAYVATKHGLEGLIKSSAAQLARHGVRVNGIAPGTVETPLNAHLLRDESGHLSQRAASILAHTPTKRFASLDGIVESMLALCIPQRHLTGNVVFCDDGYVIEGHSWPAGNSALYQGPEELNALLNNPSPS